MRWADESSSGWVWACREQQTWSREAFAGGFGGTGLSLCVDTRDGRQEAGRQCLATLSAGRAGEGGRVGVVRRLAGRKLGGESGVDRQVMAGRGARVGCGMWDVGGMWVWLRVRRLRHAVCAVAAAQ
jgi:hypothetical protein